MNESKLLSPNGIVKASALCLLMSAFSVNAAFAVPVLDREVMVIQQGRTLTGTVVDNFGDPVIGANVIVKGTTIGNITDVKKVSEKAAFFFCYAARLLSIFIFKISLVFSIITFREVILQK